MKNMKWIMLGIALFSFIACNQAQKKAIHAAPKQEEAPSGVLLSLTGDTLQPIVKADAEWRAQLSEMEYYVLRKAGTERAFTGSLLKNKEQGVYVCAGCELPLFSSDTKFDSGTGWPSFWAPIRPEHVLNKEDRSYGMIRVENVCARCGGHLGHVFEDGPKPTGLRYCMNSVSLKFVKQ
jgi:peptide-methionine (R)-S-oxide reductase